jgi:hypothetical protein
MNHVNFIFLLFLCFNFIQIQSSFFLYQENNHQFSQLDNSSMQRLSDSKTDPFSGDHSFHNNNSLTYQSFHSPRYLKPKRILWGTDDYSSDGGTDVAVDSEGNIIVVGNSFSESTGLFLLKYSKAGSLLWNVSLDDGYGRAVATNSIDMIYVCGEYNSSKGTTILWKFSSEGEQLWNQTFQELTYYSFSSLALDPQENIIVGGNTLAESEIFLFKFSSTGEQLWNSSSFGQANRQNQLHNLCIDSEGNYYLAGTVSSLNYETISIFLYKLSPTGVHLWNQTIILDEFQEAFSICLDPTEEYLYIVGDIWNTYSYRDFLICKVTSNNGRLVWYTSCGGTDSDVGFDIVINPFGDLFAVGCTASYGMGDLDFFLAKFSQKNGELLFNTTWGGKEADFCYSVTLTSDSESQHLYLVGETYSFDIYSSELLLLYYQDSDNDGLTDEWEMEQGTNPTDSDSDNDGLSDYLEIDEFQTNPLIADTDGDGWSDSEEVTKKTDPNNPASNPLKKQKVILLATMLPLGSLLIIIDILLVVVYFRKKGAKK